MTYPCPRCGKPATKTEVGEESVSLECWECGFEGRKEIRNPATGAVIFTQKYHIPFFWSRPLTKAERTGKEIDRMDARKMAQQRHGQHMSGSFWVARAKLVERMKAEQAKERAVPVP